MLKCDVCWCAVNNIYISVSMNYVIGAIVEGEGTSRT